MLQRMQEEGAEWALRMMVMMMAMMRRWAWTVKQQVHDQELSPADEDLQWRRRPLHSHHPSAWGLYFLLQPVDAFRLDPVAWGLITLLCFESASAS